MKTIFGKLSNDYGGEIATFNKIREMSDGVIFLSGEINGDRYFGDHSPNFRAHLIIFNYVILELNIYYLHHRNNE